MHDETTVHHTPRPRSAGEQDTTIPADQSSVVYHGHTQQQHDESVLTDHDGDLSGSTPRPHTSKTLPFRPQFADLSSPYENLRREYNNKPGGASTPGQRPKQEDPEEEEDTSLLFQQHTARLPDLSMTPHARDDTAARHHQFDSDLDDDDNTTPFGKPKNTTNKDPLLHRMLDKTYRIAATPHKGASPLPATTKGKGRAMSPVKWKVEPKPSTTPKGKEPRPIWQDSPTSSPEMAVPQLRSAAFMSPYKARKGAPAPAATGPRTPGVSVQTPATTRKTRDVLGTAGAGGASGKQAQRYADEITWDSDSDDMYGEGGDRLGEMSPPKTIQFALPPGRLLQTPGMSPFPSIVFRVGLSVGLGAE